MAIRRKLPRNENHGSSAMDGNSGLGLDERVAHHRDDLLANGYSIMPDALDAAVCDEIVAEFERMRCRSGAARWCRTSTGGARCATSTC